MMPHVQFKYQAQTILAFCLSTHDQTSSCPSFSSLEVTCGLRMGYLTLSFYPLHQAKKIVLVIIPGAACPAAAAACCW